MNIRRHEDYFHTADQVQGYIEEALRIIGEVELDDELRVHAFNHAIQLLQGKNITYEQLQGMPAMAIPQNTRH